MYFQPVMENNNTRNMIDTWLGYNHSLRVNNGEFYDVENMTADSFPVIKTRNIRANLIEAEKNLRGTLYTDGSIAYLDGFVFHYGDEKIDLYKLVMEIDHKITPETDYVETQSEPTVWTEQTLMRFGTYVLIFPMGVYVEIDDVHIKSAGTIADKYTVAEGKTITYNLCDIDGGDYDRLTVSNTAPTSPKTGDYWLNTTKGFEGLNLYYKDSWQSVATTYIRISIPDANLKEYFSEGDIVYFNSNLVPAINKGVALQKVEDDYVVVIGMLNEQITENTSPGWTLILNRKIPKLDYVCQSSNRVWGCRYGYDEDGKLLNEIYCSKLGDFKNWYAYQGLSTDSYSVSVGTPGRWTGCISYQGSPTFFKENMVYRLYGSYPAEFSMTEKEIRGVQSGSDKSLAILGEQLYYKSPAGIMVYDGSMPVMISQNLGPEAYYFDGVAGVNGSKYYIEMTDEKFVHYLFVYDSQTGIWTKESSMIVKRFAYSTDGKLFAMTDKNIFGLGMEDNALYSKKKIGEEYVSWKLETGDFGYEYPDFKYISRLTLRAYLDHYAEIQVEISYDDRPFEPCGTLRGNDSLQTQTLAINPFRCDHFRLRLKGHNEVRIYSLTMTLDTGSEEYGYKN